jgi:DNA-binding PadR family transcriptional regulator
MLRYFTERAARRSARRNRRTLILRHLAEHGPAHIYDIAKAIPYLAAPIVAVDLALAYADGHVNHTLDPEPDPRSGAQRWNYAITPAGRAYLEQAEE